MRIKTLLLIVLTVCLLCLPTIVSAEGERLREADLSAYTPTYETDDTTGALVIVNTHTPETKDYNVGVHWNDDKDRDGIRPDSVTLQLYNGETLVEEKTVDLTSENQLDDALQTWESLINADKYQNHGEEIQYTVKVSTETPNGYTYEYSTDEPLYVTANHEIDTVSVSFDVTFDDENDRDGDRPEEITVQLYQDDEPYGDPVVVTCTNGVCTFEEDDLPKNVDGEEVEYSIQVVEPTVDDGYTPTTDPDTGDITLTRTEFQTKNVPVKKKWYDSLDQDGLRPDSICVVLVGDTEDYKYTLTGAKDVEEWTYTFENVNVNRDGGTPIVYTVTEEGTVCQ
ncbi:MAG: Cna B-type domain-containing protein [Anaerolineaceae bacterium]|nr:Cna B-type domain-containing protein [Anaerolineaceae bacterium]